MSWCVIPKLKVKKTLSTFEHMCDLVMTMTVNAFKSTSKVILILSRLRKKIKNSISNQST